MFKIAVSIIVGFCHYKYSNIFPVCYQYVSYSCLNLAWLLVMEGKEWYVMWYVVLM